MSHAIREFGAVVLEVTAGVPSVRPAVIQDNILVSGISKTVTGDLVGGCEE
jgi:hypothetical protein